MLTPTSGNAYVYGASILTDMGRIRQSLGVCPQFDILWPEITVLEHLALYAAIKGYGRSDAQSVAITAACDVGEQPMSRMLTCIIFLASICRLLSL